MIAVDTNLLVYAHRADSPWHEAALRVLIGLANGPARWGIPWSCVHEFLGIVTHPRIYRPPTPLLTALRAIEAWAASPTLVLLSEGEDYLRTLSAVVSAAKADGPLIHDARIAAVCLSNGVKQLYSTDRDFSRFPMLKTANPLR